MSNINNPLHAIFQEPVKKSRYTKFETPSKTNQSTETVVRIVSKDAISGWLAWKDKKPLRKPFYDEKGQQTTFDIDEIEDGDFSKVKKFFTYKVWNYNTEQVEVMEVTQRAIKDGILSLARNTKWGDITTYDLTITKIKTGPETHNVEYTVTPNPHTELPKEVSEQVEATFVNLDALYVGEDPFAKPGEGRRPSSVEALNKDLPDVEDVIENESIEMTF